MHSLRLASISIALLAGCGAGARYQAIGTGRTVVAGAPAAVGPGADATAGMTAAVALPADRTDATYKVDLTVWLPRALLVDYTVRCGSASRTGVIGETFEDYRTRRLAELRSMAVAQQRTAAAVGSLVGDAVVGDRQATAQVATPAAEGQVTAEVDGAAAGAAAGAALVSTDVELANGDLGQGFRKASAVMLVPEATPGACAVELAPREALDAQAASYLTGTFEVARLDDAARWQATQDRKQSLAVRADLRAHLIAGGGDVTLRARQAEADRAARDAAAQAAWAARQERDRAARTARELRERDARLAREARFRAALELEAQVVVVRRSLLGFLTVHGADPGHRARVRAEAEARRAEVRAAAEERRLRLRLEIEARTASAYAIRRRLVGQCIGRGGDAGLQDRLAAEERAERDRLAFEARVDLERRVALEEQREAAELEAWRRGQAEGDRRAQMALGIRARLTAQLTARGGVVKPPMPEAVEEMPGEPPASGYTWASGEWQWTGVAWRWMNGHWVGPVTGGAVVTSTSGGTGGGLTLPAGVTAGGITITVGAGTAPPPRPPAQDHRPATPPRPRAQDHR